MKLEAVQRLLAEESQTTAAGGPQFIPRWHMGNQPFLDTGFGLNEAEEEPSKMGAASRLLG